MILREITRVVILALFEEQVSRDTGVTAGFGAEEETIGTLGREADATEMFIREEESTVPFVCRGDLVWPPVPSVGRLVGSGGIEPALSSGIDSRGHAGYGAASACFLANAVDGGGGAETARMAERGILCEFREMNGGVDELSISGAAEELRAIIGLPLAETSETGPGLVNEPLFKM